MSRSRAQPPLPLVLIVDDNLTTSLTLEGLLRGAGLNTIRTDTLAQAQALFQAQPVALILLDIHLPDGSGPERCRKLRRLWHAQAHRRGRRGG